MTTNAQPLRGEGNTQPLDGAARAESVDVSTDLRGTMSHRQIMTIFSGLMVATFLAALDQTVINTALKKITEDLGGLKQVTWIGLGYSLASTAVTPLYGKLADLYGRRRLFQFAIVSFVAGSLLCGSAQSVGQLAIYRGIQGIGGGGLIVLPFIIIGDILAPRQRGRYMGYFTGVWAFASVAGPTVGGWAVDHMSWRWLFLVNVPIGIVAFISVSAVMNYPFVRRDHRIDYWGAATLMSAVTCFVLMLAWAGPTYGWADRLTLLLGAATLVLTGIFFSIEPRVAEPIIPFRLYRSVTIRLITVIAFATGGIVFAGVYFLPIFLQIVLGVSATNSGLRIAPLMVAVLISSVGTGRLTARNGLYKRWCVCGAFIITVALAMFTQLSSDTRPGVVMIEMFILGLGMGSLTPVINLAVQNAVDFTDLGVASATTHFFRSMGGTVGVAAFGAVMTSRLDHQLDQLATRITLPPGLAARGLANNPEQIAKLQEPLHSGVIDAIASSIAHVYFFALPAAIVVFLLTLAVRETPLKDVGGIGASPPID